MNATAAARPKTASNHAIRSLLVRAGLAEWGEEQRIKRALQAANEALTPERRLPLFERVCLVIGAAGITVVAVSLLYLVSAHSAGPSVIDFNPDHPLVACHEVRG